MDCGSENIQTLKWFPLVSILYEFHEFDEFYLSIQSHPIPSYPILSYHPDIPNSPAGDPCRQQHHRLPAAAQRSTGGGTHKSVSHRGEDAEGPKNLWEHGDFTKKNVGFSWDLPSGNLT